MLGFLGGEDVRLRETEDEPEGVNEFQGGIGGALTGGAGSHDGAVEEARFRLQARVAPAFSQTGAREEVRPVEGVCGRVWSRTRATDTHARKLP